jgi:hypothetical protein
MLFFGFMIVRNVNAKSSAVIDDAVRPLGLGTNRAVDRERIGTGDGAVLVEDPRLVREVGQQLVAARQCGTDHHPGPLQVALGRDHVEHRRELFGADRHDRP